MSHVVYNAGPGYPALEVLEFLRARGFSPEALDDPNPDPALLYASGRSYIVRIAVPEAEVPQALKILQMREAGREVLIERASAQFRWQAVLGLAISVTLVLSVVGVTAWPTWRFRLDELVFVGAVICVGAVVATVAIARWTEYVQRREVSDVPVCDACSYILLGLTQPRCPECGHSFDPALLPLASDPETYGPSDDDEGNRPGDEQHEDGLR